MTKMGRLLARSLACGCFCYWKGKPTHRTDRRTYGGRAGGRTNGPTEMGRKRRRGGRSQLLMRARGCFVMHCRTSSRMMSEGPREGRAGGWTRENWSRVRSCLLYSPFLKSRVSSNVSSVLTLSRSHMNIATTTPFSLSPSCHASLSPFAHAMALSQPISRSLPPPPLFPTGQL